MASLILYPAVGATVLDEDGNVIPSQGIGPVQVTAYYQDKMNQGLLLRADPLASGEPPVLPPGPTHDWGASWTWANGTARTAQSISTDDIGKRGYQTDMQLWYTVESDGIGGVQLCRQSDPRFPFKRWIAPINNSALVTVQGVQNTITAPVGSGVLARDAGAGTTLAERQIRLNHDTASSANSNQAVRISSTDAQNNHLIPSVGFRITLGTVIVAQSTMMWNVQLITSAIQTSGNPNTHTQFIGFGRGAESNVQIYSRAAGSVTQVDCGSGFPAATTGEGFNAELFWWPATPTPIVVVQVTNVNSRAAFSTTLAANLPTLTLGGPGWFVTNGAGGGVAASDIVGMLSEHRAFG